MQSSSSRETTTTGSSAEPLFQHKVKCPVVLDDLPPLPELTLSIRLSPPTEVLPEDAVKAVEDELSQFGQSSERRLSFLQGKLDQLRGWIREMFSVEDVQQWAEQVEATKSESLVNADEAPGNSIPYA